MSKELMTETDVKAAALAQVLKSQPKGFGASEAKVAIDTATKLFMAQKCDADTFARVMAFLGNHSAIRQWAIAHGFINAEPDALSHALTEAMDAIAQAEKKALDEIE